MRQSCEPYVLASVAKYVITFFVILYKEPKKNH